MKRLASHSLFFGIGIALGGFGLKLFVNESPEFVLEDQQFTRNYGGRQIPADTAYYFYKNYMHEKPWFPIRGDGKKKLEGFYVTRKVLDALLVQDKCTGIRIVMGKHFGAYRREYTTMLVACRDTTIQSKDPNLTPVESDVMFGKIFDYVDPCPKTCAVDTIGRL